MEKLFDNSPLSNAETEEGYVDWADSLTRINNSQRELHESIANKDRQRTRHAYSQLRSAIADMGAYLQLRGVLDPQLQVIGELQEQKDGHADAGVS